WRIGWITFAWWSWGMLPLRHRPTWGMVMVDPPADRLSFPLHPTEGVIRRVRGTMRLEALPLLRIRTLTWQILWVATEAACRAMGNPRRICCRQRQKLKNRCWGNSTLQILLMHGWIA